MLFIIGSDLNKYGLAVLIVKAGVNKGQKKASGVISQKNTG
jgi:hypothetical protein